jgi:hypothetical protein
MGRSPHTIRGNPFYDQYAQRGGTAVDFAQEQCGLSYPEAVMLLLGQQPIDNGQ